MLWSDFMKKLVNFLKKPVIAAGVFGLAVASSGVASADYFDNVKFYVGGGLDYNNYGKSQSVKDAFNTSNKTNGMGLLVPVLGVKFNENIGLEAGYSFNKKFKFSGSSDDLIAAVGPLAVNTKVNVSYNVKVRNAYLDLMGYMPIVDQVELIGGIGLGRLMLKGNTLNVSLANIGSGTAAVNVKNKFGWRAKLGAQYNITNNFGARVMATYQNVASKITIPAIGESGKIVKNIKTIGLAALYTF